MHIVAHLDDSKYAVPFLAELSSSVNSNLSAVAGVSVIGNLEAHEKAVYKFSQECKAFKQFIQSAEPVSRCLDKAIHVFVNKDREEKGLLFVDAYTTFSEDLLIAARTVTNRECGWLPLPFTNLKDMAVSTVWRRRGPISSCLLAIPRLWYQGKNTLWSCPWPRADVYFLATQLASACVDNMRMATLAGLEYREWERASGYYAFEAPLPPEPIMMDWMDVRQIAFKEWAEIGIPVCKFKNGSEVSKVVSNIGAGIRDAYMSSGSPLDQELFHEALCSSLRAGFHNGSLPYFPELVVKSTEAGFSVTSGKDVELPFDKGI